MRTMTPNQWLVFSFLAMEAGYLDRIIEGVAVLRGQALISTRKLAERIGASRETVRSVLTSLTKAGRLKMAHPPTSPTDLTHLGSIITICEYDALTSMSGPTSPTLFTQGSHPQLNNRQQISSKSGKPKRKARKLTPQQESLRRIETEWTARSSAPIDFGFLAKLVADHGEEKVRSKVVEIGDRGFLERGMPYLLGALQGKGRKGNGAEKEAGTRVTDDAARLLSDLGGSS